MNEGYVLDSHFDSGTGAGSLRLKSGKITFEVEAIHLQIESLARPAQLLAARVYCPKSVEARLESYVAQALSRFRIVVTAKAKRRSFS